MKLTLRREALAALTSDDLRTVAGGAQSAATCPIRECVLEHEVSGRTCPVADCISDLLSCRCPTV